MTGLDTNVLVRFFTQDDESQNKHTDELLQKLSPEEPGFVSLVVLIEMFWVLGSCFSIRKPQLIQCVRQLLNSPELVLESPDVVVQALDRYSTSNADFADHLIERAGHLAGCSTTVTFDRKAAASAGMHLL